MRKSLVCLAAYCFHANIAFAGPTISLPTFDDGGQKNWILVDSRWGFIPHYNNELIRQLELCAKADKSLTATLRLAPERFNSLTLDALRSLQDCRNSNALDKKSLEQAYSALPIQREAPTAFERANLLAFRASPLTPDYDRSFWDLTGDGYRRSADPESLFTWGPFRATAGRGCTLQKILRRIDNNKNTSETLRSAFVDELNLLNSLLGNSGCHRAKELLLPIAQDPTRRDRIQLIFAQLAESPDIRKIYNEFFYGKHGIRRGYINDYISAWALIGRKTITEIDFAFFLERSLQYPRLTKSQIDAFSKLVPENAAPELTRKIASNHFNFSGNAARNYQIGRDVTYYFNESLKKNDDAALVLWNRQSRVKATDVGLSDIPLDICKETPLCQEGNQ